MFKCNFCDQDFAKRKELVLHKHQKHVDLPNRNFVCGHCSNTFTLAKNLVRHLKNVHKFARSVRCNSCQTFSGHEQALRKHCADEHSVVGSVIRTDPSNFSQEDRFILERERKSVREHFQSFRLKINDGSIFDPFEFLVLQERKITDFITTKLHDLVTAKFGICIEVKFTKPLTDDSTLCFFHSPMESLSTSLTAEEYFGHIDKLLTKINVFCTAVSGWVIEKLNVVELKISKYSPLRAGSYIATPPELETQRKSVLNIKNMKDNLCFISSVLAALFPVKQNQEGPQSYRQHINSLHFNQRKMPVALADIPVFEKNNHLKINVFAYECSKVYPANISK